ncbi:hypothetical protein BLOT_012256 [Blomia tropicalis]|nr:hypothetical protein BLOT_012256 [Blomia tropicalis]
MRLYIVLLGLINLVVLIESFRLSQTITQKSLPITNDVTKLSAASSTDSANGLLSAPASTVEASKFVTNQVSDLVAAASGYGGGGGGGGKKKSSKSSKFHKKGGGKKKKKSGKKESAKWKKGKYYDGHDYKKKKKKAGKKKYSKGKY